VLGPNAVAAWQRSPADAVALIVAFYTVLVAGLAVFIGAAGSARSSALPASGCCCSCPLRRSWPSACIRSRSACGQRSVTGFGEVNEHEL